MGNDSQNKKRGSVERAASLGRHGSVADTERKLSEARRLFSLRDFLACETVLLEVLETDPLNPKAKALSELTAIKLHRRRLYKKLVDPRASRNPQLPPIAGQSEEAEPLLGLNDSSQVHSPPSSLRGLFRRQTSLSTPRSMKPPT